LSHEEYLLPIIPSYCSTRFGITLPPLVHSLAGKFPKADPDDLFSAATDALMWFGLHPHRYDPTRPLPPFLIHIARCEMYDLLNAGKKHREKKIPCDSVEFDLADWNEEEEEDEAMSFDSPDLRAVLDSMSDVDRQLVELMRTGERRTAIYAVPLGVADRPADEQEVVVKKAKDRIKARLKRAVGGNHE
jgi:DNA-directed RNA polymerase specialized sigma24 family protein